MGSIAEKWIRIGNVQVKPKRCLLDNPLGLSQRELETIFYLSLGLSAAEIGRKLDVTSNTVMTYKTRVFNKLGVNTTAETIAIAAAAVGGAEVRIGNKHMLAAA